MAIKDYYAILMVHPQAEQFLIEVAYKRLAREYHPDLADSGPNQTHHDQDHHEKMVELNEAFAVLSNPTRRRLYDQEYARQTRNHQHLTNVAKATSQPNPATRPQPSTRPQSGDPLRGNVCPVAPDPTAFRIEAGYRERAMEGAQAWQQREHRIPNRIKWGTRAIGVVIGVTISTVCFQWGLNQPAFFAWLLFPVLGELGLRVIERIRDAHLLRYKFNPLYNPNPAGYQAYAAEKAKYEAQMMTVYVTRNAIFHAQKTCQGVSSHDAMPQWFARLRNAQPCPHCKRAFSVATKQLPPPFGKASFPHK